MVVVLGLTGANVAWGQDKQLTSLTTTSGCALSMETRIGMRKLNWTGECKNNLLEGNGVLSYESSQQLTKDRRYQNWETMWVESGRMREGKPEGLWIIASMKNKTLIFKAFRGGFLSGEMHFSDLTVDPKRKNTPSNVKSWLVEWSRGTIDTPRYAYLMAGVNAYYDNPHNFYSGNFTAPAAASAAASQAASPARQTSQADDPKVFGRSMQGG